MNKERKKLNIEIDNLTEAQVLAIEDLLTTWIQLSESGSSRWTAFYADGDGNFHPKIFVNGEELERCKLGESRGRWERVHIERYDCVANTNYIDSRDVYMIDQDWVTTTQE